MNRSASRTWKLKEKHLSDDKGAAENTDKVVHVFKREGAGMFAPQDIVSITAQGGLTICVSGLCITKRPEDWHAMAASEGPPIEPK